MRVRRRRGEEDLRDVLTSGSSSVFWDGDFGDFGDFGAGGAS